MFFSGGNEENGSSSHQPLSLIHLLLPTPTQIQKQLPVRMTMRRHPIERLKVTVDPKRTDRPVPAAQLEVSQQQWLEGSLPKGAFSQIFH
jgi:hypothetical protein